MVDRRLFTFFIALILFAISFFVPNQGMAMDSDSDGLPDWWELQYFSNPTNAVANEFSDGDSFNNLEEYIAGTDPTDENSFFAVSMAMAPEGTMLQWEAETGRVYSVLWTNDLSAVFHPLEQEIEFPRNSFTDTVHYADSAGFYRLSVGLADDSPLFVDDLGILTNFTFTSYSTVSAWVMTGTNVMYVHDGGGAGRARLESSNTFDLSAHSNGTVSLEFTSSVPDLGIRFEVGLIDAAQVTNYDQPLGRENIFGFTVCHTDAWNLPGLLYNSGSKPYPSATNEIVGVFMHEAVGTHDYRVEFSAMETELFRDGISLGTTTQTLDYARSYKIAAFSQGNSVAPSLENIKLSTSTTVSLTVEPAHPVLNIPSSSASGANTILSSWTEPVYLDSFIPKQAPRNTRFAPMIVSGDTFWEWSPSAPNQLTSQPSGTVFPNDSYVIQTQSVSVLSGNTVEVPYYTALDGTKSLVFALIDYEKSRDLRGHLGRLAGAYMDSGATHTERNQDYARRIAISLNEWAKYTPHYYMTKKNKPNFIDVTPDYILEDDIQRASDHNGLAHEWKPAEVLAFDAVYDSPALADLSVELGYNVRDFIVKNFLANGGDFLVYHVPIDLAIQSNLSAPYSVLAQVARVLGAEDYMAWLDEYLRKTVRQKLRRDGVLSEGMGYSFLYLSANETVAHKALDYFITRPAETSAMQNLETNALVYAGAFDDGLVGWGNIALPNGQLPSLGDTGFNEFYTARNAGSSALLPSYGTLSVGAGSDISSAVQLNQNFCGDGNHILSDTSAFTLWAFGNECLGNVRYHNASAGRSFSGNILAYNAVTIDRTDMVSPDSFTYGNGDLTLYEPNNAGLAVTEIDGQRAYENKASRYQRIMLLNTHDLVKPYVVDVLRVTGGTTHDYTLHGGIMYDQTWECSSVLASSPKERPLLEDGEVWLKPAGPYEKYNDYGLWENVSSNQVVDDFQITYREVLNTNRAVRLWMTGEGQSEVYIGETPVPGRENGSPEDWWVNDLWRPSSIVRKRIPSGALESLFVSVIEPMTNGVGTIQKVERLPMSGDPLESCAVRITFKDGREDTCVVNLYNPEVVGASGGDSSASTTGGVYSLNGRVGVHCEDGANSRSWSIGASNFTYEGSQLSPGILLSDDMSSMNNWTNYRISTAFWTSNEQDLIYTNGTSGGHLGMMRTTNVFDLNPAGIPYEKVTVEFTSFQSDNNGERFEIGFVDASDANDGDYREPRIQAYNDVYGFSLVHAESYSPKGLAFNPGSGTAPGVSSVDIAVDIPTGSHTYQMVFSTNQTELFMDGVSQGTTSNALDFTRDYVVVAGAQSRVSSSSRSVNNILVYEGEPGLRVSKSIGLNPERYAGTISGETRKLTGGANNAFVTTMPLPLGTVLQGEHLSLTFGALSEFGTTGISEMFLIDQVELINGHYHICFTQDHQLEITNGTVSVEQVAPLRTFTGSNTFEIVLSGVVE